ncbi:MAG: class I SAM-dependent methyltransferase [Acidobacteria bacterium]|nr:class I SAM-dependent methyltransferase [Acidobacteriota bacterium]
MEDLFGGTAMAEGYASARPAVHALILAEVWKALEWNRRPGWALDVGCGAGLSTRALRPWSERCVGLEPAQEMLRVARREAAEARLVGGSAECLPLRAESVSLISAAGSLNFCNVERAFEEMRRVLAGGGALVVYDFSPGRRMRVSERLERWFEEFQLRYPRPAQGGVHLDPARLAELASGFERGQHSEFEGSLKLEADFYARYMMTETNVAHAVRQGVGLGGIREWVETTLRPVFEGRPQEVVFEGYWAVFYKPSSERIRLAL